MKARAAYRVMTFAHAADLRHAGVDAVYRTFRPAANDKLHAPIPRIPDRGDGMASMSDSLRGLSASIGPVSGRPDTPLCVAEQTDHPDGCRVKAPMKWIGRKGSTLYRFTTTLTGTTFDQALTRTIEALKGEGFGVLSDIDVQGAMKDKLGVEMSPYRILGACNPKLAHQALQAVPDIGLLLPCNVIVREEAPERIVVGFLNPQIMVGLVGKPEVQAVADAAERLLRNACARLTHNGAPVRAV